MKIKFCGFLFCFVVSLANAQEKADPSTSSSLMDASLSELSYFQAWLGDYVGLLGRELDGLISNEADLDEVNGSKVILVLPYTVHADGQQDFSPKVRGKIELPHTHKKWKLFVSSLNEEQTPKRISAQVGNEGEQTQVGAQVQLKKTLDLLNLLDFGFNAKGLELPAVYVRYKSIYYQKLGNEWRRRWFGKLFWESDLGVGLQLDVRHDHAVFKKVLFRADSQANWWDEGQYWDLYHDFILLHRISDDRSAAYFLGWNWNTQNQGLHLSRFSVGSQLRQRLYQKWLYFEIKPLVTWREETHFNEADPSITLQLEMQFYQSPKK